VSKLPFPERVLGGQHMVGLGKTGAGKSSAIRDIVEHLLDRKKRVCIIDPKGDWWGLKVSADGKSPSNYQVVCFGDFKESRASDIPMNESSGRHVAEIIAAGNRPCVLGFRGWMPAQMLRFWVGTKNKGYAESAGFAQTIFNQNGGELYVVIDEVHNFAPKGKVQDPESARCLHWTNRIMSEGRGLGLIFIIASQRPQKVHNDTLENCETLIAMRVTHPRSREATEEWINAKGDKELGKKVTSSLADLSRGEAWVWSPENNFGPDRVQFPMFDTFDSFAPPQLQKKVSQAGWSEVNLDQVREKLASAIAEAKANDPKELKAEISRLKQELAKRPVEQKVQVEEKIIEVPVVKDAQIEQLRAAIEKLSGVTAELSNSLSAASHRPPVAIRANPVIAPSRPLVPHKQIAQSHPSSNGNAVLSNALIKVLSRLVELMECTGAARVRKEQLAAWAKYSPNSGGFNNYLGQLRSAGLIDYPSGGYVTVTSAGRAHAQPDIGPRSSAEMLARAKQVLGGSEGRLLEILHRTRGAVSKSDLAESAGFSPNSGGFNNYLGHMRTLGFVDYPSPGQVQCADWLYL